MESLKKYLAGLGLEDGDVKELEQAIKEDGPPKKSKGFGQRVAGWIGKMTAKAATGGWDVTVGAAGELMASAIRSYYGLPQ